MSYQKRQTRWFSDETNLARLRSILADPILSEAIGIILATHRPTKVPAALLNPTLAAATMQYQSGIFDAFQALENLTEPQQVQQQPQPRTLEQF